MPAFPRAELEEMMRRWIAANDEAGRTGDWGRSCLRPTLGRGGSTGDRGWRGRSHLLALGRGLSGRCGALRLLEALLFLLLLAALFLLEAAALSLRLLGDAPLLGLYGALLRLFLLTLALEEDGLGALVDLADGKAATTWSRSSSSVDCRRAVPPRPNPPLAT